MGCCLFRGGRGLRRGVVSIGRRHVDVNAHGKCAGEVWFVK